ncbi:glycosyl transferase family 2 [Capnocytophaga stomatis]|uniref:glycosyltransferase family 2 protein n=1 Tax=Capnocytophaga stomatis TaxID=1848904 RepID=UPI00194E4E24|nr:glycosyltransferase family 2 protein [Capnocytophaga stomatis]GIJ95890.1 glycosyl transferase family 2 [Capnocytophaga stomatis]
MKIAVVILNWNGKHLLEKFLPSVVKHSEEADIYVIDNASSDNSIEYLKFNFPNVQVVRNPLNGGYAQGYNLGLAEISADVYCLLNSDIEVTENWLFPIINIFKNPEIGAVQPKILDYKNKKLFEYAGAAGGFIDKYGFPFCRGRIFDTIEEDNTQYDNQTDIFWASGACFFVRSEVFHQLKGFDEDFFAHQEEIDLCWRIHLLGKRIVFCPESVVYHVGGATLPVNDPKKTFLNFRNGLFMLLKNLPQESLYKTLFIRMVLDGIAGIRFLFQGKIQFTWAIFKAHMSFYRNFFKFKNKRLKSNFSSYYITKSIVWLYFIKNKKLFSDFH